MNKHRGSAFNPADFGVPELSQAERVELGKLFLRIWEKLNENPNN